MRQDLYDKLISYILEDQNKFYRLAFSYVRCQEDALDVVQSAVCKALEYYGMLKNEEAIKTWFYRILVNESLMLLQQKKRMVLSGDEVMEEPAYEEKAFEAQDDFTVHLNQLEEDVQEIIRLRFFEELSLKEIAQIMELNLNTVKAKLYRGLKTLKINIQEANV